MTKQELLDVAGNAEWISETNVDKSDYDRLTKLKEVIASRGADDVHQLTAANVTGVWYLASYVAEDTANPQLLVRSRVAAGTYERLLLSKEICEIVNNDDEYDFDTEYLSDGAMLKGTCNSLFDAFAHGEVLTVYDSERSDAK